MQSSTHKAMLFGGALFAAGVVNAAQGQWSLVPPDPVPSHSYVDVETINSGMQFTDGGNGFHTGFLDLDSYNDTDVGGIMQSYISESLIGASIHTTPGTAGVAGLAFASAYVFATVTAQESFDVLVEWNFDPGNGRGTFYSIVWSNAAGDDIFFVNSGAGSTVLQMDAGDRWIMEISILDVPTPSTMQIRYSVIPGPSAFGMLGIAGVFGARRRRRR